jgi:hypothetical protein
MRQARGRGAIKILSWRKRRRHHHEAHEEHEEITPAKNAKERKGKFKIPHFVPG